MGTSKGNKIEVVTKNGLNPYIGSSSIFKYLWFK